MKRKVYGIAVLRNAFLCVLLSFLIAACGSGVGMRRTEVTGLDREFSARVANEAFYVSGPRHGDKTLLDYFEIKDISADSVMLSIWEGSLIVEYENDDQLVSRCFDGHFHKKGFYEYYFHRDRVEIPPLFPIVYSSIQVNRLRLSMTSEGDLLIDNKWNYSGNIFIMSGGSSGRRESMYKCRMVNGELKEEGQE